MWWKKKKSPEPGNPVRICLVLDKDNLDQNTIRPTHVGYSMPAGFQRLKKRLEQIGPIVFPVIFGPRRSISLELGILQAEGFWPIPCLGKRENVDKLGRGEDTVDARIIAFIQEVLPLMTEITHLCLGSGDHHFAPAIEDLKSRRPELKVMLVGGSFDSLSPDLQKLADKDPKTGKKMIYIFSPTVEEPVP
jgi:hypothetical protein